MPKVLVEDMGFKIIRLNEIADEFSEGGNYSIKRLFTQTLTTNPKNVGFYQTTIPPGKRVSDHCHTSLDEFLYFITPAIVKIGEKEEHLETGDLMILFPRTFHEIIAQGHEVRLIAIKIPNIIDDKIKE